MRFLACLLALFLSLPALAQEEEEKGRFVRFVEEQISSDTFRIALNGLEGSLSSNVSLDSITVSDENGVYLRIEKPKLVWNRSALLRGKLDVEELTATRIVYERPPVADDSLPDPEAAPFAIPDLPVSVEIEKFAIDEIVLGEAALGQTARLSTRGRLELDDGTLDLDLSAERLDGPGGTLRAVAKIAGAGESISLDVALDEPAGGVTATLLGLEGRPPVTFTIKGEGTIDELTTNLRFAVDGRDVLAGPVRLQNTAAGRRVTAEVGGPLATILPARPRPFVGGDSRLSVDATIRNEGGVLLNALDLDSGAVDLSANAFVAADGFVSALNANLDLRQTGDGRVTLELADGSVSLADASIVLRYDALQRSGWSAELKARDLRSSQGSVGSVELTANGTVENPQTPATRAITFNVEGALAGLTATDEGVAKALGERVTVTGSGSTRTGAPVELRGFRVEGETFTAALDGTLAGLVFDGKLALKAEDMAAFSTLTGRDLDGAVDVAAEGKVEPNGAFDLALDGTTRDLKIDDERVDPLLNGQTRLSGRAARNESGLRFERLQIENPQADIALNGRFSSTVADLTLKGRIADLGLIAKEGQGAVTLDAAVNGERQDGSDEPYAVRAQVALPKGRLVGRAVENLSLAFEGTTNGENLIGRIDGAGNLGGETVDAKAAIDATAARQSISDLAATVGATRIAGEVVRAESGLLDGRLTLASDDVSALGALALTEASGALNGDVVLTSAGSSQNATADMRANNLVFGENRVGSATIDARVTDAFAEPKVDAEIDGETFEIGGLKIRAVRGTVSTQGNRTDFDVRADLAQADADIAARGNLVQQDGRLTVTLNALQGRAQGAEVRLRSPARVTVVEGTTTIENAVLDVGGGTIDVSGTAGETLDLAARITDVPLEVANGVAPQLGLKGRVSGRADVSGTATEPNVDFSLDGDAITVATLEAAGVAPLDVDVRGGFASNRLTLETGTVVNAQGLRADVSGTIPLDGDTLDLTADVQSLPLALSRVALPDLELAGDFTGTARIGGTLERPTGTFDARVAGATAKPLREAGIEPVVLQASGRLADGRVVLDSATATNPQGIDARVSGTVPLDGSSLDLNAELRRLPLSIADGALSDLDLSGEANASATVTGTLDAPQVRFNAKVDDLSARAARELGVRPLEVEARGRFEDDVLTLESARAANEQGIDIQASGTVPLDGPLNVTAELRRLPLSVLDGALPGGGLEGEAVGTAKVSGTLAAPEIAFDARATEVTAPPLRAADVSPLTAVAKGRFASNVLTVEEAAITNPQGVDARVSGTVPLDGGQIDVDANIARLPLALAGVFVPGQNPTGDVAGTAAVSGTLSDPQATFDLAVSDATARALRDTGVAPFSATLRGGFSDNAVRLDALSLTNLQGVRAEVSGTVPLGGGAVDLTARVERLPLAIANVVQPDLGLSGTVNGSADIAGTLSRLDATFNIAASEVSARALREAGVAPLDAAAQGRADAGQLRIETATISNAQGVDVQVPGTVPLDGAGEIDATARVNRLPLAIANTVAPQLGLAGNVLGNVDVGGTVANPRVTFDIGARDASAAPLRDLGIAPVSVDASGTATRETVELNSARLTNPQGLSATASGTVPLDGSPLDVNVTSLSLPVSLANAVRPDLSADGTVTGSTRVSGTLTDPRVDFELRAAGLTATPLREAGVEPVSLDASGTFADGRVALDRLAVRNGQGVDATASGTIPLDGGTLDVSASGRAPLSLANPALAARGAFATGTARFDVTVGGTLADPRPRGLVSIAGGTVTDPLSNLRLENVNLLASLDGDVVTLNRASASLSSGGSVSASGTVGITGDLPASISIVLSGARYTDAQTFSTVADGRLRLSGPLLFDPLLSGTVDLRRTEIIVPETFGGSSDLLDVTHIRPTPPISETLARLRRASPPVSDGRPDARPSILRLDVTVNAPARIFVRGRGLDAELGGSVRVTGPVNDVRPSGRFELIRGRLRVIGRRFDLTEGSATLTGDLDPFLDLRATTIVDAVEASVVLRGRVSELAVSFESNPELPEDEVLALIVFGRSVTDLSPAQVARLLAIAQELAGGGGPGVVERIRRGTGLDDLDVVTDSSGNAAVRAGRYVNENVYLGVTAGRETEANINLDITRDLKARGSVGSNGNSKLGIFFERDY